MYRQRLRRVQACAASSQTCDAAGVIRPCVAVRGTPRTTGLSWPALGVNRGRYRSVYACPHSQTDPSIGRIALLWVPPRNVRPELSVIGADNAFIELHVHRGTRLLLLGFAIPRLELSRQNDGKRGAGACH